MLTILTDIKYSLDKSHYHFLFYMLRPNILFFFYGRLISSPWIKLDYYPYSSSWITWMFRMFSWDRNWLIIFPLFCESPVLTLFPTLSYIGEFDPLFEFVELLTLSGGIYCDFLYFETSTVVPTTSLLAP